MIVSTRHLLRWPAVIGAFVVAALACWQNPGYAHDGVRITIEHDGAGSVWATVAWQDDHPVTDPIMATLSAREFGGTTINPHPMRATEPGSIAYTGTLPAGRWTVSVDVEQPARGSCTAVLTVGPTPPAAESVPCDDGPASPLAGSAAENPRSPLVTVGVIGAAALVIGYAASALVRRRRPRPV